ncbi:thiol-disulfide oxidoreductase DCC family protein [Modestobacter sp. SYSU DS0657]
MARPVLLFDGDCGFCQRVAGWAPRVLPADAEVLAWQPADLPALGTTAERAAREVLWVRRSGRVDGGAQAVAHALLVSRRPLPLLGLLLVLPPVRWVAAGVYRLVAANRMRLPGGTVACALPTPPPVRDRGAG